MDFGIYSTTEASLTTGNISIDAASIGVFSNGGEITIGEANVTKTVSISIGSQESYATGSGYSSVAQNGGQVNLSANSVVLNTFTADENAYGIASYKDSVSNFNIDSSLTSEIYSKNAAAYAFFTGYDGTTNLSAKTIQLNASSTLGNARAIYNVGESTLVSQSILISADSGNLTSGILAASNAGIDNKLTLDSNQINIQVSASVDARGVSVEDGGHVLLGNSSSDITISSESSEGDSSGILVLGSESSLVVNGSSLAVTSNSKEALGIHVQNNTQTTQAPEGAASLIVNSENIKINSSLLGISAFSNGQMEINGNLTVVAKEAIEARGYSTINVNKNKDKTVVLTGDIVFGTPNVEGGDSNNSGNIIDAYVNVNLSGEDSSWTGRSYQTYKYIDESGQETEVVTSVIGENREYHGQVTGLSLTVSNGALINTTGDSFANILNMDSGNLNLAADSMFHANNFSVTGESNTINFGNGSNINGTIEDQGTLYMTGDVSSFTGALNVIGKASIGLTAEDASETLNSTEGSVLVVKAGTTLNGSTSIGSSASATSNGSSLSVLSDGTLAIVATDGYTEGTPLVTVGTASTEDGSTVKLVNAVKIADGTTVFETSDGSAPSEYSLVTDNLLKVVENNQIVSQSASTALGGNVLTPNVINEALTASGLGAERVVALTTETTAAQAVSALNNIALMGTASGAQTAAINAANIQLDVIDSHGSVLAGYAHDKSGADLWIDLNGSFSKASRFSAGSTNYGYKSDLAGVTIGSDYAFGNGYAAGVSVNFGTGSVRGQGNGAGIKNEVDYYGVNLYGVWSNEYFNMIGSVGYLQTKNEIKSQGYKGKPDVKVVTAGVRFEKPLSLNESITITPHVGVRYKHINMDSFNAGGFNYDSEKANLVEVPFGVAFNANLKAPCGAEVKPFIDLTIAPNFGDRKVTNKVALTNSSASDSFEARITNNSMYNAKLGLNAVKGNHSLGVSYGIGSGSYGRVDQALQAKYRYSF